MRRLLGLALFLLFFIGNTSGSYIQLTQTVSVESIVLANSTNVNVTLLNSGDESAYDVQLSVLMGGGFGSEDVFVGTLDVERPHHTSINLDIGDSVKPGRHPLVIKVNYADANGYPFSTLTGRFLIYKRPTPFTIYGRLSNVILTDKKAEELVLSVRNMDNNGHELDVALFLPNELKTTQAKKRVFVDGRSEKTEAFDIESFGALPGSTYVVTASISYEEDGLMYSSMANGIVKIPKEGGEVVEKKSYKASYFVLFALIFSFVTLVLIYFYTKK